MDLTSRSSLLVFDVDGVLVDVSESYRAAIVATVRDFTSQTPAPAVIQSYKNSGGWNNDWELAQRIVLDLSQRTVPYAEVVEVFQSHFLGTANDGLILRERWLPKAGFLERLAGAHALAIFTGRPRAELAWTLGRFAPSIAWSEIIADGEVPAAKPAPDGLLAIQSRHADATLTYVGDTVDDARSARAAAIRFIGVADPRHDGLANLLRAEGAIATVENVNQLEEVL